MASHQEVNMTGNIHGISEEAFKAIQGLLSFFFRTFEYRNNQLVIESFGIHYDLYDKFDIIADCITTQKVSFLEMDPCGPENQYRVYFARGKWKEVNPELKWPEDPFNPRQVKDHTVMFINKEDIAAMAGEEAIKNFSEADIEDIAERLRDNIENSEYFMDIFWEYLGRTIENKIEERK